MFEAFTDYLCRTADFTDLELASIKEVSQFRKASRKDLLFKEGQVARYNIFVLKGCLRLFSVSADGTEHTVRFAIENWWMTDHESYHTEKPTKYYLEALEDCELIFIPKNELEALYTSIPRLKLLKEKWEAKCTSRSQDRIHSIISETAEQKYEWFIRKNPEIFNRVPLHMIASYLGISRETISRVRRHVVRSGATLPNIE